MKRLISWVICFSMVIYSGHSSDLSTFKMLCDSDNMANLMIAGIAQTPDAKKITDKEFEEMKVAARAEAGKQIKEDKYMDCFCTALKKIPDEDIRYQELTGQPTPVMRQAGFELMACERYKEQAATNDQEQESQKPKKKKKKLKDYLK